jgi:hypothetical protein
LLKQALFPVTLSDEWFRDACNPKWEEFDDERDLIVTMKFIPALLEAIHSKDETCLELFTKIITSASKTFVQKLLKNDQIKTSHMQTPIIQGAIQKRIDQLTSEVDEDENKPDMENYWRMIDAWIPRHRLVTQFLQSNEEKMTYKAFVSIDEAKAFIMRHETLLEKFGINSQACGKRSKNAETCYVELKKEKARVQAWYVDKQRDHREKIKWLKKKLLNESFS